MTRGVAALIALTMLAAPPAAAQGESTYLTPDDFEAIVVGRSFRAVAGFLPYGVVTFLPDRVSIWQGHDGCMRGSWSVEGSLICMNYIGDPDPENACWTYEDRGTFLIAWHRGGETHPVRLIPVAETAACSAYPSS